MTYNIIGAHYTKNHPYSIILDVCISPGDSGEMFKLHYPTMDGTLPLYGDTGRKLYEELQKQFIDNGVDYNNPSGKVANFIRKLNINVTIN